MGSFLETESVKGKKKKKRKYIKHLFLECYHKFLNPIISQFKQKPPN